MLRSFIHVFIFQSLASLFIQAPFFLLMESLSCGFVLAGDDSALVLKWGLGAGGCRKGEQSAAQFTAMARSRAEEMGKNPMVRPSPLFSKRSG